MDISMNDNFLAAALSCVSGLKIIAPQDQAHGHQRFSMDSMHKLSLQWVKGSHNVAWANDIRIIVKSITGRSMTLNVNPASTIADLKAKIRFEFGIAVSQQRLVSQGTKLQDDKTLGDYNIVPDSVIWLVLRLRGGGSVEFELDPKIVDHRYSHDFTDEIADDRVFNRGGRTYLRPYGWNRVALDVKDKYGDSTWLGGGRYREESHNGEWPVSYHGTTIGAAENIAAGGYDIKKGTRFLYGGGIYSSPDPNVAEMFAECLYWEGKKYKVMVQNRVKMDDTVVISNPGIGNGYLVNSEYFVTSKESSIRPYGILFKEVLVDVISDDSTSEDETSD